MDAEFLIGESVAGGVGDGGESERVAAGGATQEAEERADCAAVAGAGFGEGAGDCGAEGDRVSDAAQDAGA